MYRGVIFLYTTLNIIVFSLMIFLFVSFCCIVVSIELPDNTPNLCEPLEGSSQSQYYIYLLRMTRYYQCYLYSHVVHIVLSTF